MSGTMDIKFIALFELNHELIVRLTEKKQTVCTYRQKVCQLNL